MSNRDDVIVVGGGTGGLMCATRLARAGLRVSVLERASRTGGRALSPLVGTVPMNLGAHALYLGGPAERTLTELGVSWSGFQPRARDIWLSDEDGLFESPTSLFSLLGSRLFAFGERFGLLRFFGMLDRMTPSDVEGLTAGAWIERVAPGPRAKRFLHAMVRVSTYTNAPSQVPAEIALKQLQSAVGIRAKGVAYVDGGWQSIVSGLESAATSAGVRIERDVHVVRVTEDARAVLASGEERVAGHVVLALPRASAIHLVGGAAEPRPVRAACLDMVLEDAPSRRVVFGLEEPHYFSVHTPASETPPLRAHALRYLAPDEIGAEYKRPLEEWLARVVPGLRVVASRFLPEMEVASAVPSCAPSVPPLARVSFVGDWASATHVLLDAVAESTERATARIKGEKVRAAA